MMMAAAKKFYEAKAKTEAMALANVGNEKAQSFLKGELDIYNLSFTSPSLLFLRPALCWA